MSLHEPVDLVVVGGGLVGAAAAYEACCAGMRVVLLDRGSTHPAASAVAAGMLAPVSEATLEPALVDFALASCRWYPHFVAQLAEEFGARAAESADCGYRQCGSLLVALHRDHLAELAHWAARQRSLGLAIEEIDAAAIAAREPRLSPRIVGGYWAADDHRVDPRALLAVLHRAIEGRGGKRIEMAEAVTLHRAHDRVAGLSYRCANSMHRLHTEHVLLAAGAWSAELWQAWLPDAPPLPLRPVKGQIVTLRGEALMGCVLRTPDVYLVPQGQGELCIGATMEEQGFDARPTAGAALQLLHDAWLLLPGLEELQWSGLRVGFRPALRDNLPAIGPTPLPGLWLATGHYRHGVMLAPLAAKLLVQAICTGHLPATLAAFSPQRWQSSNAA